MAQPVDLLVDGSILFDIGVRMGNIRLRLVVIVVGNEVLYHIFWKKLPELRAQLGRQGLVVGQHQSWPVELRNNRGHGKGLAGAGDTQ